MGKKIKRPEPANPVAKYARKYNRAVVFADRKKALKNGYHKHKNAGLQGDVIAA